MIRKLSKPFLFLLLVGAASLWLHFCIYPRAGLTSPTWGSDRIYHKAIFLKRHAQQFDAVFIGSSMVFRQVNPAVFDSAYMALTGDEIHSFNFGVNWLGASELLYLMEELTKESTFRPRVVFAELQKIKMPDYGNFFTTRVIYWYTWEGFLFTVRGAWHSGFPLYTRLGTIVAHVINYAGSLLNLGYLTEAFRFRNTVEETMDGTGFLGPDNNGFISLDYQQELNRKDDPERVSRRNRMFLEDTSLVTRRNWVYAKVREAFDADPSLNDKVNTAYSKRLNSLVLSFAELGTRLVFFVPPRLDRKQYFEVLPVLNSLPAKNRMNLADPARYPEFYLARYSFDVTHMNAEGARVYSCALAAAWAELDAK